MADGRLVGRRGVRGTTWPITIELSFADAGVNTQVTVNGKIGGWGPIQRKAVVGAMDELRASIEFEVSKRPQADTHAEPR